jgi:glycosyltransferase involved in cell wall biosynthesis
MPKVSVILPVHNGMPYLPEAVQSIQAQSSRDWELVLIDDGSQDESASYIEAFEDDRIRIHTNPAQMGLAASLNKGFALASGEYIARMDADDVAEPQRLERQIRYFENHAEVAICGTWARTFGGRKDQEWRYPERDADIKAEMLFASVIVHSSAMFKRSAIAELGIRYDESLEAAQDYALWVEYKDQVRFANVPEFLMHYRIHTEQVGERIGARQQEVAEQVREKQLADLGIDANSIEKALHHRIARWDFKDSVASLKPIEVWLLRIVTANTASSYFDAGALGQAVELRWWNACRRLASKEKGAWDRYQRSNIAKLGSRTQVEKRVFAAKSALYSFGMRQ